MIRALIIALVFILSTSFIAKASQHKITNQLIIAKNKQMQSLLQQRDPRKTIDFLHSHVSEQAIFQVSFENTTMPTGNTQQQFQMDKASYINSFIQGLHYVDQYNVQIDTKNIQISQNGKTAIVEEIIIEEGVMLDPNNVLGSGMPFISKTSCKMVYGLNKGVVQSDKAECHTQTGETSSI